MVLHVYLTWNNKQYIQTSAGNPYTTGVTGSPPLYSVVLVSQSLVFLSFCHLSLGDYIVRPYSN